MNEVKLTHRGWVGHFCAGERCLFRLNTLIERDDVRVVVSTVGNMRYPTTGKIASVGHRRWFETMAFRAKLDGPYWDADVLDEIGFESPWSICADKVEDLPPDVDNRANEMHAKVVAEIAERLAQGETL